MYIKYKPNKITLPHSPVTYSVTPGQARINSSVLMTPDLLYISESKQKRCSVGSSSGYERPSGIKGQNGGPDELMTQDVEEGAGEFSALPGALGLCFGYMISG